MDDYTGENYDAGYNGAIEGGFVHILHLCYRLFYIGLLYRI